MPHVEIALSEIPINTPFRVEHEGLKIVVVRTESQVAAFEDACPHAFWPLSDGIVRDGVLECPGHGWEFRVSTGRCVNAPSYCLVAISVETDGPIVRMKWDSKVQTAKA
jgi:nitrite reductase/ring-hydroxylating ferredoxin subunit